MTTLVLIEAGVDGVTKGSLECLNAARSFLDGHFVLTRALADSGHYPAIDVEQSISRVMINVTHDRHRLLARKLKSLWSRYQASRDLLAVGAYVPGSDPETDQAIALQPAMAALLQQDVRERASIAESRARLESLIGPVLDGPPR